MRLTQATVVAILAFTAAATPIAVRGDDAKATQEYQKCCEQRDKYDHSKICIPPKVEVPHVPKPVEDGKYPDGDDDGKDHHPEVPKEEEHKEEEHKEEGEKPKPVPEHPEVPEHKDEHDDGSYKPHKPEPEHPSKPEHPGRPEGDKDDEKYPTPPKPEQHPPPPPPKPEHPPPPPKPESPAPPKPQSEHPTPPQPEKENDDEPQPPPQPKPVPQADQHGYYTFGEEISLKCEGGKIVIKGHKY
ncbi:uncharacterized protein ALTATR162_LOCUS6014 [Alternaria atra]|uniref:Proline-rich protein n=1 Tax=Alternaria atra TaxID=119953 RepID=A0A8J2N6X4_9PLEO|nr:uncharacterized protein ALTATR162_LOCUS6014 [Alternaria atra]CAG5161358.1 unnamed protein product [Alternaria atra]